MESTSNHIVAERVSTDIARIVIEAYKEGTLGSYTFEIADTTINMQEITPFVKKHMGRKYAAAHIYAMKELKKVLRYE